MKYFFLFLIFSFGKLVSAQRIVVPLNEGWEFTKDDISVKNDHPQWTTISFPHTWNRDDVIDDVPGYYRGVGWYRKIFPANFFPAGKDVFLLIAGANQYAAVFVNGENAGTHLGGYTAFNIPLTGLLKRGSQNEIIIKVDNKHDVNIPPLTADFTFYGGVYREVSLMAVDPVHFSPGEYGDKGLFISTPFVDSTKASISITSAISNTSSEEKKVHIQATLYNAAGKFIRSVTNNITIAPGSVLRDKLEIAGIIRPHLWSPSDPYLYKSVTRIIDADNKVLDEIIQPVGFRWFRFDAAKGCYLNGKPLKLIGASRHQDHEGMGNAVPVAVAQKDVKLLKEMGGNFLRVAHYPQDQSVLDACDKLGILASVEIPVVNEITESDSFYNNCMHMQVEMIRQNFNHPSIVMWCYMNEVLLRPAFKGEPARQQQYFSNITVLAKRLDSLTRNEDPSRYTMIANHGNYNGYRDIGLLDVPMIVGWNLYPGWYGARIEDLPVFLDRFHKDYPLKPMMITEYGADADPRIRSAEPVRFDKSVEYAAQFHQYYFKTIMERPFVAAGMVWNLADFNSETRAESMPHINNKGLLTWNRTPKDPYYFYKAVLTRIPFVKILGASHRAGIADSTNDFSSQKIQIATNTGGVQLMINGRLLPFSASENGIVHFDVDLKNGLNQVKVIGKKNGKIYSDSLNINCKVQPSQLKNTLLTFSDINILCGANRFFTDSMGQLWQPGQQYRSGGWGYVGGKAYKISGNGLLPYGTDKNISGTYNDPVYQTQQTGLSAYRFDVPDGTYELTFHFSELEGGKTQELVYNLDSSKKTQVDAQRIFDVIINGETFMERVNLAEQYGRAVAVKKKTYVRAVSNKGINIIFKALAGEAVLNAIQLKKTD